MVVVLGCTLPELTVVPGVVDGAVCGLLVPFCWSWEDVVLSAINNPFYIFRVGIRLVAAIVRIMQFGGRKFKRDVVPAA